MSRAADPHAAAEPRPAALSPRTACPVASRSGASGSGIAGIVLRRWTHAADARRGSKKVTG
jgi:hypothetical protein